MQQQLGFRFDDLVQAEPEPPTPEPPALEELSAPLLDQLNVIEEQVEGEGTTGLIAALISARVLPRGLGKTIEDCFACMGIAEEEIDDAKKRYPEKAEELQNSFRFLRPTDPLENAGPLLYRLHARELLDRVALGHDLSSGTDAEVIASLSKASTFGPPGRAFTLLYMALFQKHFPEEAANVFEETGAITPDTYERVRMEELDAEIRRKVSTERDCHAA